MDAAIFARCAGFQGKFWEAYDALYDAEIPKSETTFSRIGSALKLNINQLYACRQDKDLRAAVQLDLDTARNDGVDSAPLLFIGTKAVRGPISPEALKQEIDLFLAS
jgi:protein-disulfide isomerase